MTCKKVEGPHLDPGWGCCACEKKNGTGVYNGEARSVCKVCGHERCDLGELREDTMPAFLAAHGKELLAVIRPKDATLALKTARKIMKKRQRRTITNVEADKQFNDMLGMQEYRFVGILDKKKVAKGVKPRILDPRTGQMIDHLRMGDSFVPYHLLRQKQAS